MSAGIACLPLRDGLRIVAQAAGIVDVRLPEQQHEVAGKGPTELALADGGAAKTEGELVLAIRQHVPAGICRHHAVDHPPPGMQHVALRELGSGAVAEHAEFPLRASAQAHRLPERLLHDIKARVVPRDRLQAPAQHVAERVVPIGGPFFRRELRHEQERAVLLGKARPHVVVVPGDVPVGFAPHAVHDHPDGAVPRDGSRAIDIDGHGAPRCGYLKLARADGNASGRVGIGVKAEGKRLRAGDAESQQHRGEHQSQPFLHVSLSFRATLRRAQLPHVPTSQNLMRAPLYAMLMSVSGSPIG